MPYEKEYQKYFSSDIFKITWMKKKGVKKEGIWIKLGKTHKEHPISSEYTVWENRFPGLPVGIWNLQPRYHFHHFHSFHHFPHFRHFRNFHRWTQLKRFCCLDMSNKPCLITRWNLRNPSRFPGWLSPDLTWVHFFSMSRWRMRLLETFYFSSTESFMDWIRPSKDRIN